jgi:hypothetical protein
VGLRAGRDRHRAPLPRAHRRHPGRRHRSHLAREGHSAHRHQDEPGAEPLRRRRDRQARDEPHRRVLRRPHARRGGQEEARLPKADPCPPEEGQIKGFIDEPSIQSLQGQISEILKDIKKVTETLSQDQSRDDIKAILENLASVTKELNETVKDNRQAVTQTINNVNNITGNPDIPKILENVRVATDDVKRLLADNAGGRASRAS